MPKRDWGKRLSYFVKGHNGPLSYWDVARVIGSITLQVLIIQIIIGVGLSLWSLYETDRQAYREYQQRAGADQQKTANDIASRCNVILQPGITFQDCIRQELLAYQEADTANKDLQAQQDMARWAFWMLAPSFAGLFISVGGLWMLWRSLQITREAISTDREVGHAQVRAYLSIEPKMFEEITISRPMSTDLEVTNTGQSPARSVKYIASVIIDEFPLKTPPTQDIITPADIDVTHGTDLSATASFVAEAKAQGAFPSSDLSKAMKDGGKRIYLVCHVYYVDVFNQPHVSKACFFLEGKGPVLEREGDRELRRYGWIVYPTHNSAT